MGRLVARRPITRVRLSSPAARSVRADNLAVEEPLELRIGGQPVTVTMRTPGHDVELLHGFLVAEGVIAEAADVTSARYCDGKVSSAETGMVANTYNVVDVVLADPGLATRTGVGADVVARLRRAVVTSSACGVCGAASIEAIRTRQPFDVATDNLRIDASVLAGLPDRLREQQRAFDRTGGLHAAGLFDRTGAALCVREDVGRHNAVDKVVGWALLNDKLPLAGTVLAVSGRASFELVQKAVTAGIPMLAAVSAPSSLAAELAEVAGLTLAGFVRGSTMNLYARADRVG